MNLYVHFPFCRSKCFYCALPSRAGSSQSVRQSYVAQLCSQIEALGDFPFDTIYFGGGTPLLCNLAPLGRVLAGRRTPDCEFTVEVHPLDVSSAHLEMLAKLGVNRISMGVQSFNPEILQVMGRPYTPDVVFAAFASLRQVGFTNVGLDLIAGFPGVTDALWRETLQATLALKPRHVSVYTLICEPCTRLDRAVSTKQIILPGDEVALSQLQTATRVFADVGLLRYEISNFACSQFECRHNLATWLGEDYYGIGSAARGRQGLKRTEGGKVTEILSLREDAFERAAFSLRTRYGFSPTRVATRWPVLRPYVRDWRQTFTYLEQRGIVQESSADTYVLTSRGMEVCDAVLAQLMPDGLASA